MENHIPPLIKKILIGRGFKTEKEMSEFLFSGISSLSEPFAIPGMREGCEILKKSILGREKIFIYGDGDTDGICGAFFLLKLLKLFSVEYSFRLTHRLDEDYEIEETLIDDIKKEGYSLLISVDCGISSFAALENAKESGIKCIVLDHHISNSTHLPSGHIYIDPFVENNWPAGTENLSGAGIAFKFVEGMALLLPGVSERYFHNFIEVICLSILADFLPLTGENRILVKEGIYRMPFTSIKGLAYLIARQNICSSCTQRDITRKINPRLNSPGRLGKPEIVLNLLMEEDDEKIQELVDEIEKADRTRYRNVSREMLRISPEELNKGFIISESISPGICGIIASRLSGKYNRPYLVGSTFDNLLKGSIRAPKGYNLYERLKPLREYMHSLGGHSTAMGFKCSAEHLDRIKQFWEDIDWQMEELHNHYDCELNIDELTPELIKEMNDYLEPYGKGNPAPVFLSREVLVKNITRSKNEERTFWVIGKKGRMFESFLADNTMDLPVNEARIDILYNPRIMGTNGLYRLYLKIYKYSASDFVKDRDGG